MFSEPAIERVYVFQETIKLLIEIILVAFSVILLVTIFMLSTYISNNIKVNSKKIGVLKAIGVTTRDVASIFLVEAIIISVVSFLLSLAYSQIFIYYVNIHFVKQIQGHKLEYIYWNLGMTLIMFILAIGLSVAAATFPLLKLSKKKPVENIREVIV